MLLLRPGLAGRDPVDKSRFDGPLPGGLPGGPGPSLGVDLGPFLLAVKMPVQRIALAEEPVEGNESDIVRPPRAGRLECQRTSGSRFDPVLQVIFVSHKVGCGAGFPSE